MRRDFSSAHAGTAFARLAVGLLLLSRSLHAASATWTGVTDANWSTATNWTATPVPGTGDTATFNGGGNGNTTLSLGTGVTIRSVVFDTASAAAYTLGSGAAGSQVLTLDSTGSVALNATVVADQTIAAALRLGANATTSTHTIANSAPGRTLTLSGGIAGGTGGTAGAKTLTLNAAGSGTPAIIAIPSVIGGGGGTLAVGLTGGGTVVLGGTNTFTGALSVNAGTLSVPVANNSNTDGPLGRSTAAVGLNFGTLLYTGATATSSKRLSLTNSGTVSIADGAAELTLSGIIDGDQLVKSGPGTLVLSGINTHAGLSVLAGTARLAGSGSIGGANARLNVDARFDLNGRSITTGLLSGGAAGRIVNNGTGTATLTDNNTGISFSGGVLILDNATSTFAGILADNDNAGAGIVALRKDGPGELVLTGANTYSGATQVIEGSLTLSGGGTLGSSAAGTSVSAGGTLTLDNITLTDEAVTIAGAGVNLVGFGPLTYGALDCYGTSTFAGGLALTAAATIYVNPPGNLTIANPSPITGAFALTLSGNTSGVNGSVGAVTGVIGTGTGAVNKAGTGTWTLSGANTFGGILTIASGTLAVPLFNNASTPGPLGSSANAVTFNQATGSDNPTLLYTGGTATSSKRLAVADYGTVSIANAPTDLELSGVVSGAGTLQKSGPGTLAFSGLNTYTGGTVLAGGTLRMSGAGRLSATTGGLLMSGGTKFDLGGTSQTVSDLTTSLGSFIVNNGGGSSTLTINTATSNSALAGVIADNDNGGGGTVSLVKSGTGNLSLSGANTYSGTTTVTDGTLTVTGAGTLGNAVGLRSVASGGTLVLGTPGTTTVAGAIALAGAGDATGGHIAALEGFGATYGGLLSLTANATVAATGGTFALTNPGTITGAGFTLTLTGGANGSLASILGTTTGGLTKTGTGTWVLSGANTYSGTTTVSAGILELQNDLALGSATGATSITAGATLQLRGGLNIVGETITVRGAGAANANGALVNVSGANTLNGTVTLGAASTISSDAGLLSLTGASNITGAFALTLTGAGDGAISSPIATGAAAVTKSGSGTWTLSGANAFTGALTVADGVLAVPTVNNASTAGPLGNRAAGVILGAAGATGTLAYTGATAASTKPFTLATGGSGAFRLDDFSATLTLSGVVSGSGGLIKSGPGTLVLSGSNTYTGSTSVLAGTLSLPQALLPNAADVNLTSGATLNLTFVGSDAINQLRIDGVVQSAGTWGGPTSSATFKTSLISGPGTLTVGAGAALPPFASWAAANGLLGGNAAFTADPDGDGLNNGMEWILDGNPQTAAVGVAPQLSADASNLLLTFTRNDASEVSATLVAQWGTTLGAWTDVPIGPGNSTSPDGVVVTVTENAAAADTVVVAFPRALAAGGRLFVRLRATMP